jgi:para-aminobenzoate synthetase component I
MNVRSLPNLNALCTAHSHVALLWDERLEGRALLGVGARRSLEISQCRTGDWQLWEAQLLESQRRGTWSLGWLGYDLHASLDLAHEGERPAVGSPHPGEWPLMCWWEPEVVLEWKPGSSVAELVTGSDLSWSKEVLHLINTSATEAEPLPTSCNSAPWARLEPGWTPEQYREKFEAVQRALHRGDIYEMNLCMPWSGSAPGNASWPVFAKLAAATRAPHSAYVQAGNWRLLCASPERFLAKSQQTLKSQPIKGTVRRGVTSEEDLALKASLAASEKERAENVMIVDLVRNDLSRVAARDSVEVEELFGVHSFATVHQMISTVTCTLRDDVGPLDIFRATFPMGSMTGAPKLSAMRHIAELEGHGRGVYSGAVGYVDPGGDWDFNVVIRSLLHRADTGRVDATVGGAITLLSEMELEHEECLLKAEALRTCLAP